MASFVPLALDLSLAASVRVVLLTFLKGIASVSSPLAHGSRRIKMPMGAMNKASPGCMQSPAVASGLCCTLHVIARS